MLTSVGVALAPLTLPNAVGSAISSMSARSTLPDFNVTQPFVTSKSSLSNFARPSKLGSKLPGAAAGSICRLHC